jgi:hypothetical protein
VQGEFERQNFETGFFQVIGARVETTWVPGAFQLWVRGSQRAPPRRMNCIVALLVHHITSTPATAAVIIPPGRKSASAASKHMGSMQ